MTRHGIPTTQVRSWPPLLPWKMSRRSKVFLTHTRHNCWKTSYLDLTLFFRNAKSREYYCSSWSITRESVFSNEVLGTVQYMWLASVVSDQHRWYSSRIPKRPWRHFRRAPALRYQIWSEIWSDDAARRHRVSPWVWSWGVRSKIDAPFPPSSSSSLCDTPLPLFDSLLEGWFLIGRAIRTV
ncbi:hypothetical protein GGR56DRAFT_580006 [Xylariaceae sp. FL0804]|nr:hypothetical protein GGR56DRAFT_580006 [Xylariaceae sp. FL0804]